MPSPLMWPGAAICSGVVAMADLTSVCLAVSLMLSMVALVVALLANGHAAALAFALLVGVVGIITCPSPP